MASKPEVLVANKQALSDLLTRRFFVSPAFDIYGGVAGLYDYGPPGCAVKSNLIQAWRQHFVLEEGMLELESSALTPYPVLKASGHVERFADVLITDPASTESFRADHLLEDLFDKMLTEKSAIPDSDPVKKELRILRSTVGGMKAKEIAEILPKYPVTNPNTKKVIKNPEIKDFNLMFSTTIGPTSQFPGFMRPELAQGIFVNFRRLLEQNGNRMPFACTQIGQAFRNEIAPRNGLLRVREFTLAEIEHFCDPLNKHHPRFEEVAHLDLPLLTAVRQEEGELIAEDMNLGKAVADGVINNPTLGYFLGRTYLFLQSVGIKRNWLRFRQHCSDEMAHYAADCWDAEINTSYGWTECVGHADRSCYDLQKHAEATGVEHVAREDYPTPRTEHFVNRKINKTKLGQTLRKAAKVAENYLEKKLSDNEAMELEEKLAAAGKVTVTITTPEGPVTADITREMVAFSRETREVNYRAYTPSVIEPSFGLGRIIYCILEHSYYQRPDDEQRAVLGFPAIIAPIKCSIMPLSSRPVYDASIKTLDRLLTSYGLSHKVDASGVSIGRRYARTDEIGVPYGITIDDLTVSEDLPATFETVTLRERDSTEQVFGKIPDIVAAVSDLSRGIITWTDVKNKFTLVTKKEDRQRPGAETTTD